MASVLDMKTSAMVRVFGGLAVVLLSACGPFCFPPDRIGSFQTGSSLYRPAPAMLPWVRPEMKSPGFWISRIQDPDRVVLGEEGIAAFNTKVRDELGLTRDPANIPADLDGPELRADLNHWLNRFTDGTPGFRADGSPAGPAFFDPLASNMDILSIGARVTVQWGMVTTGTDQRLLPTGAGLFREAGDTDIDRLQNNRLNPGTPVAVLHRTADRRWVWTKGPDSDGWVRSGRVALCSRQTLVALDSRPFATVIRAKASLYLDERLTRYAGFAPMGTRLMLAESGLPGPLAVLLPLRGQDGSLELVTGFVKGSHAVEGMLPFTPRHVIGQAFELLNAPYGWGGTGGEQDCSQFVQQVFATMGLHLPRNSAAQAEAVRKQLDLTDRLKDQERLAVFKAHAQPGLSLLYMKGHIMLYLGEAEGQAFAIHSLWGYRDPGDGQDVIRVLNRVAVTGLDLGRGSSRGSLMERLESVHGMIP